MPDLSNYLPPGVYVEDASREIADALNPVLNDELLCIVAPALGYVAASENLALSSEDAVNLANRGVVENSIVVKTPGGAVLVKDTDYAVGVDSTDPDAVVTSLTRLPADPAVASPGGLLDGGPVVVTYNYADAAYFQPQVFTNHTDLARVYGPALSDVAGAANPVVSPLSLASKIAFENGASRVMAVAVDKGEGTWAEGFQNSYALLETDHRVSVLVAVFPDGEADSASELSALVTDLRLHVDATAANGFGRLVLTGAAPGYDEAADPFEEVAQSAANKRIVTVYPTRFTLYNQALSQTVEVGGGYAAAAIGGRLMLNAVERGVTREVLNTLTGLPTSVQQKMSRAFKDNLAKNGVLVIETNRANRLVVRHGITTDTSSIITREISLVRIADVLLQDVQVGLENSGLIGDPIDDEMSTRVKSVLMGILETEMAEGVIVNYANVLVRQQALPNGDPSVIECQFAYRPAVPLNYITVQFTLDLNSGVVAETDVDNVPTTG